MVDERQPPEDSDADTEMFRAFVAGGDGDISSRRKAVAPFRILSLLIAVVVLAGIVWLLLR
jgi:hypothetical protein